MGSIHLGSDLPLSSQESIVSSWAQSGHYFTDAVVVVAMLDVGVVYEVHTQPSRLSLSTI